MLADKYLLVSLCAQLSILDLINKQPPLLAADRFHAMAQAVMSKASPEAIFLVGGLILGGI